jgi:predicted nucleic acid-binding protein
MAGLTLDTGALIALEQAQRRAAPDRVQAIIEAIADDDRVVTVPSPVVAEWWRGQRGPAARVLDSVEVEPMDRAIAEAAGLVLASLKKVDRKARENLLLVDAVVVIGAAARGDTIYTSDVDDLERLRVAGGFDVKILGI